MNMDVRIEHRILFVLSALGLLSSCIGALARENAPSVWVRGVVRASKFIPGKDAHESFQLQVIRGGTDSLIGLAVLTREISENGQTSLLVEGVERDGRFWPYLRGEVNNDLDKARHDIGIARPTGKPATRTIEPHTLGEAVFVELTAFRSHVGRERYGRFSLPGGEAAAFFLDNLKPPARLVDTWERGADKFLLGPYEQTFLVPIKEQQCRTFMLLGLAKDLSGIVGHFNYVSFDGRSKTIEEQVNDYEEPIWPRASLKVTNDYHGHWKNIGETSNPEKTSELKGPPQVAISLNIYLDAFEPMIGQFRYGQVVLPTGDSTIIELADLLPPEKELIAKEHPAWQQ